MTHGDKRNRSGDLDTGISSPAKKLNLALPDYFVVLHFVTSGTQGHELGWDEAPIVMVTCLLHDATNNKVAAVHQIPVNPWNHPRDTESECSGQDSGLSEDCKVVTGLQDEHIEGAVALDQALEELDRHLHQMRIHAISDGKTFEIITDGPVPLRMVLHPETVSKNIDLAPYPYFFHYHDLRTAFAASHKVDNVEGLEQMLEYLDISPDVSIEYGVRKCQDMSRIISRLILDGHRWEETETINEFYYPRVVRKTDTVGDDTVVRARGLPWQATDADIHLFFRGLNIARGGIALVLTKVGRRNGEALVCFETTEHRDLALRKHKHHMARRYIEVYPASGNDFIAVAGGETEVAEAYLKRLTDPRQTLIRMRGLPYTANSEQILEFFANADCPVQFGIDGVLFVNHPDGRATGDAFVIFAEAALAERALLNHRQHIGNRYVELFKSTPAEVNQVFNNVTHPPTPPPALPAVANPDLLSLNPLLQPIGTCHSSKSFIRIRGMPGEANVADILAFLDVLAQNIALQGVHLVYNSMGQPAGEAVIQMTSTLAALTAVSLKNRSIFSSNGRQTQVEVIQCSPNDVDPLLGITGQHGLPAMPNMAPTNPQPGQIFTRPIMTSAAFPSGSLTSHPYASAGLTHLLTSSSPSLLPPMTSIPRFQPIFYPSLPPALPYAPPTATPLSPHQPQIPFINGTCYYPPALHNSLMSMVIAKGLPKDAVYEEILALFESIIANGSFPDIKVGVSKDGIPTGEAFINFGTRADAEKAVCECNRQFFRNHCVELILAQPIPL